MLAVLVTSVWILMTIQGCSAAVQADLITELPGANFVINFKQYSGYLQPDTYSQMHYWLVESQKDPANDPLLLWLNGGPGCSSLDGLFTENGPFRVTNVNNTIEENVYAWNKVANVLYLESPQTVGFSYTTNRSATTFGDNQTALLNYNTLIAFFAAYPEYINRTFYISGESYAGVYLPTLAMYLIQDENISPYFKGMAIGNGALSDAYLTNSIPALVYEHGLVGQRIWNNMTKNCCNNNGINCDYESILRGAKGKDCLMQVVVISTLPDLAGLDPYNLYDTCYVDTNIQNRKRTVIYKQFLKMLNIDFDEVTAYAKSMGIEKNMQTLDTTQQYPDCYYDGVTMYLQRQDVRKAIHIPDNVPAWQECTNFDYVSQYDDMAYQLKSVIDAEVRVLIYNGDCDTVCNGMGDKQFIDSLGRTQISDTQPWVYNKDYQDENAGWQTSYDGITFLSVRGSGHFVPADKPREALQMIANFIWNRPFSTPTNISIVPATIISTTPATPTKSPANPTTAAPTQKDADRILSLPGANFPIKFNQYSGYIQPTYTTFMHYWFLESQRNPSTDPLLLWLNGGPGCSSLDGLLTENGPFRVTNMNQTIEENVYAWNKVANVLYLESPTSVGFSYTTNPNTIYGDNQTAELNYNTIKIFLELYPEYKTRDFYISGESYGGIYLPTLAMLLIKDRSIKPYFKGMAVGNGYLSVPTLTNSIPPLFYEHLLVGERLWNNMTGDCCDGNGMECDYARILAGGNTKGDDCYRQVTTISILPNLGDIDPYNLYDTCYIDFNIENRKRTAIYKNIYLKRFGLDIEKVKESVHSLKNGRNKVTDSAQQYPDCYYDGITMYLQRQDVRQAIHIPNNVPPWVECSDFRYNQQYEDMAYQLKEIVKSGVRVLIYNGDVDTVCNAIGDKQFIDSLGFEQLKDTTPWTYDHDYGVENAGWETEYQGIKFITVRGSGHFVPHDKPREALQMIANFIWDRPLSTPTGINVTAQPLFTDTSTTTTTSTKTTTTTTTIAPTSTSTTTTISASTSTTTTPTTTGAESIRFNKYLLVLLFGAFLFEYLRN